MDGIARLRAANAAAAAKPLFIRGLLCRIECAARVCSALCISVFLLVGKRPVLFSGHCAFRVMIWVNFVFEKALKAVSFENNQ
jgi:hypothetical protein